MEPLTISFRGNAQARPGRRVTCNIETPDVAEIKVEQHPEDPEVFYAWEWMSAREFFAHMRACLEDGEILLNHPELPCTDQPMRLTYELVPEDPTAEHDEPCPDPVWTQVHTVSCLSKLDFEPFLRDVEPKEGLLRGMVFVLRRPTSE